MWYEYNRRQNKTIKAIKTTFFEIRYTKITFLIDIPFTKHQNKTSLRSAKICTPNASLAFGVTTPLGDTNVMIKWCIWNDTIVTAVPMSQQSSMIIITTITRWGVSHWSSRSVRFVSFCWIFSIKTWNKLPQSGVSRSQENRSSEQKLIPLDRWCHKFDPLPRRESHSRV